LLAAILQRQTQAMMKLITRDVDQFDVVRLTPTTEGLKAKISSVQLGTYN
jgi:hypothetical protein